MASWIPQAGVSSRMRLDDLLVVDLDVHLLDTPADLAPFCEQPWRQVLEERQDVPPYGGGARLFPNFPDQWEPRWSVAQTPETLRTDLDALGIDLAFLFPEAGLGTARQPNREYASAIARAYNRWLVERYLTTRGFYGGIIATPQDPEGAAREIARYARHERVVGVVLPTSGVAPLWGDRRYDPIYRAAQEHGLAVLYHAGGALGLTALPFDLRQFDTWFMQHTYSHSIALLSALANLFATAVPARFPELRMLFIEGGVSWFAEGMQRLDWAWTQRRDDVPLLTEPPSYYMRRQMFVATQPIEEPENASDLADVIRVMGGEDTVIFASDYPHHDFDHPRKVFQIPGSPEMKRKIMGENALRALALPYPSAAERVPRPALAAPVADD